MVSSGAVGPACVLLPLLVGAPSSCGPEPAPSPVHGSLHDQSTGAQAASGGARGGARATGGITQASTGGAHHAGSGGAAGASASAARGGGEPHSGPGTGGAQGNGGVASACEDSALSFEERCHACATDDCGHCVCSECATAAEECERRQGCAAIAACVLEAGCEGAACFCGSASALRCLAGEANGPCKDVILSAPGGRSPTLDDPSGGPAADAAVALGACTQPDRKSGVSGKGGAC